MANSGQNVVIITIRVLVSIIAPSAFELADYNKAV